jgi:ATP-binding cassette subfamily B protein
MADYYFAFLAAVNQVFSLFAPAITGNILDKLVTHPNFLIKKTLPRNMEEYLYGTDIYHGVFYFLGF